MHTYSCFINIQVWVWCPPILVPCKFKFENDAHLWQRWWNAGRSLGWWIRPQSPLLWALLGEPKTKNNIQSFGRPMPWHFTYLSHKLIRNLLFCRCYIILGILSSSIGYIRKCNFMDQQKELTHVGPPTSSICLIFFICLFHNWTLLSVKDKTRGIWRLQKPGTILVK
jgi:hypothetical protein